MKLTLTIRNRQHARPVDLRLLRRIVKELLAELLQVAQADVGIYLIATPEMTRLNETFLHHAGSTDVITFDYADKAAATVRPRTGCFVNRQSSKQCVASSRRDDSIRAFTGAALRLHGEIFVSVDEAILQMRKLGVNWQSEIVRYIVHGVLHLLGFDDARAAVRRKMKREENRLLRELSRRFSLAQLARSTKLGV